MVEADGWRLVKTRGSHRQYKHPVKKGRLTIAGHPSHDLYTKMKYVVLFERTATGYSAHLPNLPGCVATGAMLEETLRLIGEAVEMHLEGMREDGEPIPEPSTVSDYITIPA